MIKKRNNPLYITSKLNEISFPMFRIKIKKFSVFKNQFNGLIEKRKRKIV